MRLQEDSLLSINWGSTLNRKCFLLCSYLRVRPLAIASWTSYYTGDHSLRSSCAGQSPGENIFALGFTIIIMIQIIVPSVPRFWSVLKTPDLLSNGWACSRKWAEATAPLRWATLCKTAKHYTKSRTNLRNKKNIQYSPFRCRPPSWFTRRWQSTGPMLINHRITWTWPWGFPGGPTQWGSISTGITTTPQEHPRWKEIHTRPKPHKQCCNDFSNYMLLGFFF